MYIITNNVVKVLFFLFVKGYPLATTSEATPKIEPNINSMELTFTGIFGNVVTTDSLNMTVDGNPSLLNHDNVTFLNLNGHNQWLEIPKESVPCASGLSGCISGFTFQIAIKVKMMLPLKKTIFISSGNDNPSSIAMFYKEKIMFATVKQGQEKWMISTLYTIDTDKLYTYQISWSKSEGAKLYVNNVLLAVQQAPVTISPNSTIPIPFSNIRIGGSQGSFLVTNIRTWTTTRTVLSEKGILQSNVYFPDFTPVFECGIFQQLLGERYFASV